VDSYVNEEARQSDFETHGAPHSTPEFISADTLYRMQHEPTRWAVPGILPEGVTLFGGKPKTGKSWMGIDLGVSIGAGGHVLGAVAVEAGPVLYLALEDNKRRLTKRLRILCGDMPPAEQIEFLTDCPRLGSGGEDVLRDWLQKHPTARLIVIDTLQKFRPHASAKDTAYANDYAVGEYLTKLCVDFQVSILVLAHLRKLAGDDPIDELSGTLGLSGGVDGYMVLRRQAMSVDATLYVEGRDVEEPAEYCIQWQSNHARWKLTEGNPLVSRLPAQQRRVYDALCVSPKNLKELTEALNPGHVVDDPVHDAPRKACSKLVHQLKGKGLVERRTFDFRWSAIHIHSSSSSSSSSNSSSGSNGSSEWTATF
jgi:AAA domain